MVYTRRKPFGVLGQMWFLKVIQSAPRNESYGDPHPLPKKKQKKKTPRKKHNNNTMTPV
jgi:hypothetical protein